MKNWVCVVAMVVVWVFATAGWAVNIEIVPVGNPGNTGELSGVGAGGYGDNRICGAVGYTYNIGKYEVTAGQYTEFLNAVAKTDTYGLYNADMWNNHAGCKIQQSYAEGVGYSYTVASDYANRPVNYVSFWDSCRFANWLHNGQPTGSEGPSTTEAGAYTLTTDGMNNNTITRNVDWKWAVTSEDEWYKAAYYDPNKPGGAGYWHYPTGSDTAPGRDMADASGNNANYYPDSGPYPIDSGKYTTVVDEFQNSDSPYGTFDQGGNVYELNEAVLGSFRGMRGGSFADMSDVSLRASSRGFVTSEFNNVGFRVSEVPEPASMAMLAFGGIGMLVRRRGVRG